MIPGESAVSESLRAGRVSARLLSILAWEDDPKEILADYTDDVQINLAVCMYMFTSKRVRAHPLWLRVLPDLH